MVSLRVEGFFKLRKTECVHNRISKAVSWYYLPSRDVEHPAGLAGTEATGHSEQSMDVLELGQLSVSDEGQHEAFLKPNPVDRDVIKSSKQVFKLSICNKVCKINYTNQRSPS